MTLAIDSNVGLDIQDHDTGEVVGVTGLILEEDWDCDDKTQYYLIEVVYKGACFRTWRIEDELYPPFPNSLNF